MPSTSDPEAGGCADRSAGKATQAQTGRAAGGGPTAAKPAKTSVTVRTSTTATTATTARTRSAIVDRITVPVQRSGSTGAGRTTSEKGTTSARRSPAGSKGTVAGGTAAKKPASAKRSTAAQKTRARPARSEPDAPGTVGSPAQVPRVVTVTRSPETSGNAPSHPISALAVAGAIADPPAPRPTAPRRGRTAPKPDRAETGPIDSAPPADRS